MEKKNLYIYKLDKQGNKVKFPNADMPARLGEYTYSAQRMAGTPTLTATLNYPSCLDDLWTGEEFVEFRGEKYYVDQIPTSSKDNKSIMYKHELQFVSERIVLENVYLMDVVTAGADTYHSNSTSVKFMGDIHEFVGRVNASMTKSGIGYSVVIDDDITSDSKLVSLDNVYLADALQSIYTIYDLPYYFVGKVCHIGYTEHVVSTPFEYRKGLVSIKRTNANYKIVNRITGVGSSDNIPFYYPNDDETGTIERSQNLMPSIYRQTGGAERFYNALNNTYKIPGTNDYYSFKNTYSAKKVKEIKVDFSDIKPTIEGVTNASGQLFGEIADIAFDENDSDELGTGEGNNVFNGTDEYVHSYFYIKLHIYNGDYGFNLFEQGLEGGTAVINMTTGDCAACEFEIGVTYKDGDKRAYNPVLLGPTGNLIPGDFEQKVTSNTSQYVESQQDTSKNEVWIAVKKDNTSFGVIMPNATNNYRPSVGDKFVITGIKMPKSLVLAAEKRLEEALIKYMSENNDEKFTFSVNFSRVFLADNTYLWDILNENARIYIKYNNREYLMYVNSFTCKADKNCLYDISVELVDKLSANVSALRSTITEIAGDIIGEKIGSGGNVSTSDILSKVSRHFISKRHDDRTPYKVSSDTAFEIGEFVSGASGAIVYKDKETGQTVGELDKLYVRMKAYFETLEIIHANSVGGKMIITPGGSIKVNRVEETETSYRCYFLVDQDGEKIENRFVVGDQGYCQVFNAKVGVNNNISNHYYWRLVTAVGNDYIELSKPDCDTGSGVPVVGDVINQRGNRNNIDRQNVLEFSSVDSFSPSIMLYQGIDSYSLVGKDVVSYGVDKTTGKAFMNVYGEMYVGDREGSTFIKYTQDNGVEIKGKLAVGTTIGDGKTIEQALEDATQSAIDTANENISSFTDAVTKDIEDLQNQIDGAIETWFNDPAPTLTNYPANKWTTNEEKNIHLGDLYYSGEGKAYRFQMDGNNYVWKMITDSDITKALADAKKAQDTADGKRTVFVKQPTNADSYQVGDLWVNATYSTTYSNDVLRAVSAKTAGSPFSIKHWTKASKYTDDTKAEQVQQNVNNLSTTVNTLSGTVSGMKDFTDTAFADGIVDRSEASAIDKYMNNINTTKADVQNAYNKVYENALLDGKAKTDLENAYNSFSASATELVTSITNAIADGITTSQERADVDAKYTNFNAKYGEFVAHLNAANKYIQDKINATANDALTQIGGLAYLKKALREDTTIEGGLIQSSVLALGYTNESNVYKVMSGTNGIYDKTALGGGIASWWGGAMKDRDTFTAEEMPTDVAKALIRMDGSGYLADHGIWWGTDGKIHADPQSFIINENQLGDYLELFQIIYKGSTKDIDYIIPQYVMQKVEVATSVKIGNAYLKYDSDSNSIYVEGEGGEAAGFWTKGFISSKGLNPGTGGGDGSATALYQLNDVAKNESETNVLGAAPGKVLTYGEDGKWYAADAVGLDETALASYLTSNNYAKKSDIPSLSGYATENWVNAQLNNKVDNVVGMGLSHNDFTDALLAKLNGIAEGANKYILPVAKAAVLGGVMVGSTLTASATGVLNLPEVMTAGTYAKVTTDAYGRVTGGFSLSASDIPTLSVSKIAGLQDALDKKIDKSDFATEFDKAMQRWFVRDTANKGLHPADYDSEAVGLYSDSYISSKGVNPGTGGGTEGASSLGELNNVGSWADTIPTADRIMVQRKGATHWESLNLSDIGLNETQLGDYLTTNNYAKKSDIPSLSGYATEKWVLDKGYITSAALTDYATQSWVNTQLGGYATSSALKAVSDKLDDFLTGTDTDNVINKWKELEAFLAGFQETDTLAGALTLKADKAIAISAGTGLSGGGDLSANRTLSLNTASATALGGIKVGNRLSIDANGVLSATYTYTLPTASATVLGGVKVGTTLNMAASGVLDIKAVGTAGTYFKVTTDAYGRVTSGSNPTTLAGFGITDGVNAVTVNGAGNAVTSYSLSRHTLTLVKGTTFLTKAAFDDLFEKVNIGTSEQPMYAIRAKYGFYTDGFISSKGLNPGTGGTGGGSDYDRLDAWSDYTADKAGYVLSAGLGNDLNTRLKAVEVNGAVKVTTLGSGNVVTAVSQSGNVITFTKGITALTAHQSLANYMRFDDHQNYVSASFNNISLSKKASEKYIELWDNISSTGSTASGWWNLMAGKFIKSGGTASQVLMADGSVQSHWKAADVSTATTDAGMLTPLAMNQWTSKTFVTALGTSGNYLTWTKNGVTNNITVPYASNADKLDGVEGDIYFKGIGRDSGTINLNTYRARVFRELRTGEQTTENCPLSGYLGFLNLWDAGNVAKMQLVGNPSALYYRFQQSPSVEITNPWKRFAFVDSNVASATKLATARTINGTSFDGTANITTANWGTARAIGIVNSDGTGTAVTTSVNGSASVNLKLPATIKAALTGNANTATALQTARTINGTSFNGSANIVTSYWGTARNIKIGEVTKSVNGSANVEFTRNDMKVAAGAEVAYIRTPTANGWYRIASTESGIGNSQTIFSITAGANGYHTNIILYVGTSYGVAAGTSLNIIGCSGYVNALILKVRIVYTTSYSNNYAHLEIQLSQALSTSFTVKRVLGSNWNLAASMTAGSIPSGYLSKEITPYSGAMTNTGDVVSMGVLKSIRYGNIVSIGSENTSYAHFRSGTPFWFSHRIEINGNCLPFTNNSFTCGSTSNRWSNVYATAGNFSNYIDIGSIRLTYDRTNNAIKVSKTDGTAAGLYTEGFLSSKGLNAGSGIGGGGTDYDRLDAWSDYAASKAGWVLSAGLGNDLNTRLKAVEQGGAMKVSTLGSGNAVTAVSKSGTTITVTKGATFSLSSHTHSYLPLAGGTITGALGKSNNYLFKPNGGDYRTKTATVTGAICISLPANVDNTMISMWIDVYNYVSKTSFSVHVGGYTFNNSTFTNAPFAMVYGAAHKVRLTYNNGFKIYIGETNSTWSYPQVSVRDVVLGFGTTYTNWLNSWSVSFVTAFPATINAVFREYAYTTLNKPSFSDITSKPTTLAGYGITDAVTISTAQTITGKKTFSTGIIAKQNNDFIVSSNEFNFVPSGYSADVHFNYRTAGGTNGAIGKYTFHDGKTGYAGIYASRIMKHGGTVSQFLMADGSVATKKTLGAVDSSGWVNAATDDLKVPTMSFIAYWNGRYDASRSNLQYCDRGRFGDIVTQSLSGLDSRYVNASGDTMTGKLTISHASVESMIINSTGEQTYIRVQNAGTSKSCFGWHSNASYGTYMYSSASAKYLGIKDNGTPHFHGNTLVHAANYTSIVTKLGTATIGSTAKPIYLNAGTPTALSATVGASNRPVYLNAGTITAASVSDAYLSWANTSISGTVTPVDCAASNLHSANRLAFAKPAGIVIEKSTNSGSTWVDYGATNAEKVSLVSGIGKYLHLGGVSNRMSTAYQLRITLNATNMGIYTRARKLLINVSTNGVGGLQVKVEKAMKGSETTFATVGTYGLSGWSGWNSIPLGGDFGGSSAQTGNIAVYRFTFFCTSGTSTTTNANVSDFYLIGDTYWLYNSRMGKDGHLYSYNSSQEATFPAQVTATSFSGPLSGNATTATSLQTARTLWGKSFNGTANVSGDMTGVGSITASGTIATTGQINSTGNGFYANGANAWFRNDTANKGLYNSAGDARWYWNGTGWYSDKLIIVGGRVVIDTAGRVRPAGTNTRRAGMYGVYDSTRIGHIWSIGLAYQIADDGANFGNLYGFAYKHTNNTTGGTMANGHQAVWCVNGTPKVAMGDNLWTSGSTTTSNIVISSTDAVKHIAFSRANFNYITAPAGGHIAFVVNGKGIGDTTSDLIVSNGQVSPGTNNATSLGLASRRWSNTYTQLLNVAGAAKLSSTLSVTGATTFTGRTTHNGGITATSMILSSTGGEVLKFTGAASRKIWFPGNTTDHWAGIEALYTPVSNLGHNIQLNIQVGIGAIQFSSTNGTLLIVGQNEIRANGVFHNTTGMYSDGYVSSKGQNTSDVRLKTDIKSFNATSIIKSLRPVSFKWNNLARKNNKVFDTDDTQYGLIAQEVKTVAPWAAVDNMFKDGYMGVRYEKFIPVIMKAQIETIDEVEGLKRRLSAVERENERLKKEIQMLKVA